MDKRKLAVVLALVLVVSFVSCKKSTTPEEKSAAAPAARGVSPASPAEAGGLTAKAALEQAREKARAWQADAVLLGVNALNADRQGKVVAPMAGFGWTYVFRSDKAMKNLAVYAGPGEMKVEEVDRTSIKPITGDFVDSDQAIAEAIKNGFQPSPESDNYMGIVETSCPRGATETLCWKIKASNSGQDYFAVSGKTGKFVGTTPW